MLIKLSFVPFRTVHILSVYRVCYDKTILFSRALRVLLCTGSNTIIGMTSIVMVITITYVNGMFIVMVITITSVNGMFINLWDTPIRKTCP